MNSYTRGDQLCPLGFHPQVRFPLRCKRCYRDYKDHGNHRAQKDITTSSPSLSSSTSTGKTDSNPSTSRNWTSSTNLSISGESSTLPVRPSSWTSTPDLEDVLDNQRADVSVSIRLPPQRRHTANLDFSSFDESTSVTIMRPPIPPKEEIVIYKTDSLAERVRKMNLMKKQGSVERETSRERSVPRKTENEEPPVPPPKKSSEKKREHLKNLNDGKPPISSKASTSNESSKRNQYDHHGQESQDVKFLIQVKNSNKNHSDDSSSMSTCTETTETTLVDRNNPELVEQIESLKRELDVVKQRCERAERDKSDILLKRLSMLDTIPSRTAASEALKLQQKVNELNQQNEDLSDEKKSLSLRVRELEQDLQSRPERNLEEQLRSKLQAAEVLCEELMDENEDMKREIRNLEEEMDEMHDSVRETQADEYSNLKKKFDQETKNCRVLSFKLKKAERRVEQLEGEKQTNGAQANSDLILKIKELEEELKAAHEVSRRLQSEAELAEKNSSKKKTPSLGMLGKSTSADGKFSRESITRGGSQDDPAKLLRDLQDSMEREADLREQLKYAEEEAESLRKKSSRVEDENESLMMQLKKMAKTSRSRKLSPTAPINRLSPIPIQKDEGISDEEDPAELRVLLELNEQETSVLRRKVEELETENTSIKKQMIDFQEKFKGDDKSKKLPSFLSKTTSLSTGNEKKIKVLEDEITDLKKKFIEKDKIIKKLEVEAKSKLNKTKSGELSDSNNLDFKRQLQMVEQEATILRTKITTLELENDKLSAENKKLAVQAARGSTKKDGINGNSESLELIKARESLAKIEKEKNELSDKLKRIIEENADKLPQRTAKKFSETHTKFQLKKMIEELEDEVAEMRAIVVRTGGNKLKEIEKEKLSLAKDLKDTNEKLIASNAEIKQLKSKQDTLSTKSNKLGDVELKLKKTENENEKLSEKLKSLEEKLSKQEGLIKQIESQKSVMENQNKTEKDIKLKLEKELEKEKKEKSKWESKAGDLESDMQQLKKSTEKTKSTLEKEITNLKKSQTNSNDPSSKKLQELKDKLTEVETNFEKESKKYKDLTGKYEILEEEHVLTKAQLTTEKEKLGAEINSIKSQLEKAKSDEARQRQENTDLSQKLTALRSQISSMESKDFKNTTASDYERNQLKKKLEERDRELDRVKSENDKNNEMIMQLRRDNEETQKKLDDFDKVNKVQRSLNDHNNSLEQELKKMQMKLENAEHSVKTEVASTRLRYEQQITNLQTELGSLQRQCERFKRDRDAFKQLLEAAQKSMAELKQGGRSSRASNTSGDEDDKSKIQYLEQQIGCLEDELSEARLESSKTKTELVSEKSAAEIKLSEMQSKLNELEEERLLGSGRTKIPGMKTRLELSWQKEREELTRLLQETSTLARDLRQTLFEVERERDKDKLESKRKLDQIKKTTEEEMDEGRHKISELQCDLLELRDAHAKLRTANEKLRRERERYERERDNVTKRRIEQDGERKVGALLQTVEEFVRIAPDLQLMTTGTSTPVKSNGNSSATLQTPNPPRRSKSRSPSPGSVTPTNPNISGIMSRLAEAYEELRKYQKYSEDEKDHRYRRGGMRRAASQEGEEGQSGKMKISRNGSLYRKSLSLDQTIHQDQAIWKQQDDGSMSSMQSIDSDYNYNRGMMTRESSMDSRLSGGSTQSDMPRGARKKKRGLMGKLRSLTKSRGTESDGSQRGSDSDLSISGDHRSSKKDLKERLSGMFRRSGTGSRQNSTEVLDSTHRPVAITVNTIENGPGRTSASTPSTPHLKRTAATKPPASSTPSTPRKTK